VPEAAPTVRRATPQDIEAWLVLRLALWPDHAPDQLRAEMPAMLDDPGGVVLGFGSTRTERMVVFTGF
jgi:hypothetical protein